MKKFKKVTVLLAAIAFCIASSPVTSRAAELPEISEPIIEEVQPVGGSCTLYFDTGNGVDYEPLTLGVGTAPQTYELPTPEREGFAFLGWVSASGTDITGENPYDAFDEVVSGATATVTAMWGGCGYQPPIFIEIEKPIVGDSCTLNFDAGNGVEYEPLSIGVGTAPQEYELPTPTRKGFAFLGWYSSDLSKEITSENVYDAFDEVVNGATATVTAMWGGCGYIPPIIIGIEEIPTEETPEEVPAEEIPVEETINSTIVPIIGEAAYYSIYDEEEVVENDVTADEIEEIDTVDDINIIKDNDSEIESEISDESDLDELELVTIEEEEINLPSTVEELQSNVLGVSIPVDEAAPEATFWDKVLSFFASIGSWIASLF